MPSLSRQSCLLGRLMLPLAALLEVCLFCFSWLISPPHLVQQGSAQLFLASVPALIRSCALVQVYISFNDSFSHGAMMDAASHPFKTKITKELISGSTCPVALSHNVCTQSSKKLTLPSFPSLFSFPLIQRKMQECLTAQRLTSYGKNQASLKPLGSSSFYFEGTEEPNCC